MARVGLDRRMDQRAAERMGTTPLAWNVGLACRFSISHRKKSSLVVLWKIPFHQPLADLLLGLSTSQHSCPAGLDLKGHGTRGSTGGDSDEDPQEEADPAVVLDLEGQSTHCRIMTEQKWGSHSRLEKLMTDRPGPAKESVVRKEL